jgi:hypothetical protein
MFKVMEDDANFKLNLQIYYHLGLITINYFSSFDPIFLNEKWSLNPCVLLINILFRLVII